MEKRKHNNNEDGKEFRVYGIKIKDGYLLSEKPYDEGGYYTRDSKLSNYKINGEKPEQTFHKSWVKTKHIPTIIHGMQRQKDINKRFELTDKSLISNRFPAIISEKDARFWCNESDDWRYTEEFKSIRSLYEFKADKQEDKVVEIPFTYVELMEIENVLNPNTIRYKTKAGEITGSDSHKQFLDKILYPDIVLHNRPSKFTSKQVYDIVRGFIKSNINLNYARITSDYGFCFTVKKVIKPKAYDEIDEIIKSNSRPYHSPKLVREEKLVTIFEMTHEEEKYKGYSIIPEMIGENIDDLKQKMDKYCKDLIEKINEPLHHCEHCDGIGVINYKK